MSRKRRIFQPRITGSQGTVGRNAQKAGIKVNRRGDLEAFVTTSNSTKEFTNENFKSTDLKDILAIHEALDGATVTESEADASRSQGRWIVRITVPRSTDPGSERPSAVVRADLRQKAKRLGFKVSFNRTDKETGEMVNNFAQCSDPYWIEDTDSAYYVPTEEREGTGNVVDIKITGTLSSEALQELTCAEYCLRHHYHWTSPGSGTNEFMPVWRKPKAKPSKDKIDKISDSQYDSLRAVQAESPGYAQVQKANGLNTFVPATSGTIGMKTQGYSKPVKGAYEKRIKEISRGR